MIDFSLLQYGCECGSCKEKISLAYDDEFGDLVRKYRDVDDCYIVLKGHELTFPKDWEAAVEETEHFVVMELKSDTVSNGDE